MRIYDSIFELRYSRATDPGREQRISVSQGGPRTILQGGLPILRRLVSRLSGFARPGDKS